MIFLKRCIRYTLFFLSLCLESIGINIIRIPFSPPYRVLTMNRSFRGGSAPDINNPIFTRKKERSEKRISIGVKEREREEKLRK